MNNQIKILSAFVITILVLHILLVFNQETISRLQGKNITLDNHANQSCYFPFKRICYFGANQDKYSFIFVGDSMATNFVDGLSNQLIRMQRKGLMFTTGGCLFIDNDGGKACREIRQSFFSELENRLTDTVLITQLWQNRYADHETLAYDLDKFAIKVSKYGVRNLIIVDSFLLPNFPTTRCLGRQKWLPDMNCDAELIFSLDQIHSKRVLTSASLINFSRSSREIDVKYFDPLTYFCSSGKCSIFNSDGVNLFVDSSHYSHEGSNIGPLKIDLAKKIFE